MARRKKTEVEETTEEVAAVTKTEVEETTECTLLVSTYIKGKLYLAGTILTGEPAEIALKAKVAKDGSKD